MKLEAIRIRILLCCAHTFSFLCFKKEDDASPCHIEVHKLPQAISSLQSLQKLDSLDINVQVALAISSVTLDVTTIPTIVKAGAVSIVFDLAKYARVTYESLLGLLSDIDANEQETQQMRELKTSLKKIATLQTDCVVSLCNMSQCNGVKATMVEQGAIQSVLSLHSAHDMHRLIRCVSTLHFLALHGESCAAIVKNGALEYIMDIMEINDGEGHETATEVQMRVQILEHCASAICSLSKPKETRAKLVKCVPILTALSTQNISKLTTQQCALAMSHLSSTCNAVEEGAVATLIKLSMTEDPMGSTNISAKITRTNNSTNNVAEQSKPPSGDAEKGCKPIEEERPTGEDQVENGQRHVKKLLKQKIGSAEFRSLTMTRLKERRESMKREANQKFVRDLEAFHEHEHDLLSSQSASHLVKNLPSTSEQEFTSYFRSLKIEFLNVYDVKAVKESAKEVCPFIGWNDSKFADGQAPKTVPSEMPKFGDGKDEPHYCSTPPIALAYPKVEYVKEEVEKTKRKQPTKRRHSMANIPRNTSEPLFTRGGFNSLNKNAAPVDRNPSNNSRRGQSKSIREVPEEDHAELETYKQPNVHTHQPLDPDPATTDSNDLLALPPLLKLGKDTAQPLTDNHGNVSNATRASRLKKTKATNKKAQKVISDGGNTNTTLFGSKSLLSLSQRDIEHGEQEVGPPLSKSMHGYESKAAIPAVFRMKMDMKEFPSAVFRSTTPEAVQYNKSKVVPSLSPIDHERPFRGSSQDRIWSEKERKALQKNAGSKIKEPKPAKTSIFGKRLVA